jgi:hypothetical protein
MKTLRLLLLAPFGACFLLCTLHSEPPAPAPGRGDGPPPGGPENREEGPNLLLNGSFEQGTAHWELLNWGKHSRMQLDPGEAHEGHPSLRVENFVVGHSFVRQVLTGKAHTHYRLSGYIKTRNIEPSKHTETSGALVMAGRLGAYSSLLDGTREWTEVSVEFTTNEDPLIHVGPSIGTDSTFARGTAWFAELKLVELHEHDRNASALPVHPRDILSFFRLASEGY